MTKRDTAFQVSIDSQIKLIGTSKQQVAAAIESSGMTIEEVIKKFKEK